MGAFLSLKMNTETELRYLGKVYNSDIAASASAIAGEGKTA